MNDKLAVSLFGGLQIERNGQEVTDFASRKAQALVAYLAATNGSHTRERLATMLWDDRSQESSLGNLRVLLTSLRKGIGPFVSIQRQVVSMNQESELVVDVVEFERVTSTILEQVTEPAQLSAGQAKQLDRALSSAAGEFLAGFNIRNAREFEAWVTFERERLQHLVMQALEFFVDYFLVRGQYAQGVLWAQRLTQLEPLHERGHQQLMLLLAGNNQRNSALAHYESLVTLLDDEMGIAPSVETVRLYEQILNQELSPGQPTAQQNSSLIVSIANRLPISLPVQLTPLIGRENEQAHIVERLLDPNCRLLTLVGPGGIGKTRLGLSVAQKIQEQTAGDLFPDGVYFVPLEGVSHPNFIATTIAEMLGIILTEAARADVQLINYLRHKHLLLLTDNFEHLTDGADLLLSILQAAPGVKILVTSRERLNFHGEWLFEVEGLPYPERSEQQHPFDPDVAQLYGAVQLFERDARSVAPGFDLDAEIEPVIDICHSVDGMPLGIQLAAASARTFSCAEILQSIRRNFDFLQTDMRNLPARHRSLRAVFEHSWELLDEEQQRAMRQLAVFAGSFSLDAATYVAGVDPMLLNSLVNRSLIQPLTTTGVELNRYKIHAVLRQYADGKLEASPGEEHSTHDRHATFFIELLWEHESAFEGSDAATARRVIGVDIENIRSAWRWVIENVRLEKIGRGLTSLSRYYLLRGPFQEGSNAIADAEAVLRESLQRGGESRVKLQEMLSNVLAAEAQLYNRQARYGEALNKAKETIALARVVGVTRAEAKGHLQVAQALRYQGDYESAVSSADAALQLALAAKMPDLQADSLLTLGLVSLYQSRYDTSLEQLASAVELYRHMGNSREVSRALNGLGNLFLYQGQYSEARSQYEQALEVYRSIGDRHGEGQALNNIGAVAHHMGDFDQANVYYEQALSIREQLGEYQGVGLTSGNLGLLACHKGMIPEAQTYSLVAQRIAHERGDRDSEAFALYCLAQAHIAANEWGAASQALQHALELRLALGQINQSLEAQAGIMRVELETGHYRPELHGVDAILVSLENNNLIGIIDPFGVYWTCYEVLLHTGDERASTVLETIYRLLRERADQIRSTALRHQFLNSWPARRKIMEEYIRIGV